MQPLAVSPNHVELAAMDVVAHIVGLHMQMTLQSAFVSPSWYFVTVILLVSASAFNCPICLSQSMNRFLVVGRAGS